MFSSVGRFSHSVRTGLRLVRYAPGIVHNHRPVLPITCCRTFFGSSSGSKTEKVRTPKLDEVNRDDGSGCASGTDADGSGASGHDSSDNAEVIELKKQIDVLNEKLEEVDEKYKRALAEIENTRIRMRKQVDDVRIYGIQNFCKDLLEVADILQAAIKSIPKDQINDEFSKSFVQGVEMTEKQLQTVFRRNGLVPVNPVGAKFDPNEHHALFEAEDGSKEPGTVAAVTQIGYKLHERVIRPAKVGVVKGRLGNE